MKSLIIFLFASHVFLSTILFAQSTISLNVQRIGEGLCNGPESIAIDNDGFVYSGMDDGQIIRFNPDGLNHVVVAQTNGRPLGLQFNQDGNLLVCDAYEGLLSIDTVGNITTLSTGHGGKPFKLTDDLDILPDGLIYFTDASHKYSLDSIQYDYPQSNGRLLVYNPITDSTNLVLDSLYFANGVAISPDLSFLLVNESWKNRVRRFWLSGPQQGQSDIYINLSSGNSPDNITCNGKDIFWVAIYGKYIYGLDLTGNIKYIILFDTNNFTDLTSVIQHNDKLYLGSLTETAIGVIQLPDSIVSIKDQQIKLAKDFFLSQNYPNPFNPSTTIEFSITKTEFVSLKIYNLLGQEVANLVSEKLKAGNYKFTWDASYLASGMYLYKLETESYTNTKKSILLR